MSNTSTVRITITVPYIPEGIRTYDYANFYERLLKDSLSHVGIGFRINHMDMHGEKELETVIVEMKTVPAENSFMDDTDERRFTVTKA